LYERFHNLAAIPKDCLYLAPSSPPYLKGVSTLVAIPQDCLYLAPSSPTYLKGVSTLAAILVVAIYHGCVYLLYVCHQYSWFEVVKHPRSVPGTLQSNIFLGVKINE